MVTCDPSSHRLFLLIATVNVCTMLMGQGPLKRFAAGETHPHWVGFEPGLAPAELPRTLASTLAWPASNGLRDQGRPISDRFGQVHDRYDRLFNGIPVHGAVVVIHNVNGQVKAVNGSLVPITGPKVQEPARLVPMAALENAKRHVGASAYMWESPEMEAFLQRERRDSQATFLPKALVIYYPVKRGDIGGELRLAYKLDIHARKPLSRQDVVVDAITGEILASLERIHHIDEPGTAQTAYSGNRPIMTYRAGTTSNYELRDMSRGSGIVTYDCFDTDDYANAQTPAQATNTWNYGNLQDNTILDAHWGTEKTYDFYLNNLNWDSYDNAGAELLSYVHFNLIDFGYSNNNNAFWDGSRMTYGDGDGITFNPLTALDVTGHEITHGVTEFSAALEYSDESGALNESFSDIFGACVEHYAKPEDFSWRLGNDMSVNGEAFRDMSDPNQFEDPDTYQGDHWDGFGSVHTNSGVQNFWFYLLSDGGNGVNDNGDAYAVQGIGMDDAAAIAFRNLSVYLTVFSDYAEARTWSIQAALDLFGACSDQVVSVTNAWHAVGVGNPFDGAVTALFTPSSLYRCSVPADVSFSNSSTNASGYQWSFGDGGTSTLTSPTHTYTSPGTYVASLIVTGSSACNTSDTAWSMPIVVEDLLAMVPAACSPTAANPTSTGGIFRFEMAGLDRTSLGAMAGYEDMTCESDLSVTEGFSYPMEVQLSASGNVAMWIDLDNDGAFEANERVFASVAAAPFHQAEVIIPGGAVFDTRLRLRVVSDVATIASTCSITNGQAEDYAMLVGDNTAPPIADFTASATTVLPGTAVDFQDLSLNVPTGWAWFFPGADITTSTSNAPQVTYNTLGTYDVHLIASNAFGSDTLLIPGYIQVINSVDMCDVPTVLAESGIFYDPGGSTGAYSDSENCTLLIAPPCAETITVTFNSFATESCCDHLYIYDGINEQAPQIGYFSGSALPGAVTSTGGSLFVRWLTDNSVTAAGFAAEWDAVVGSQDTLTTIASVDNNTPAFGAPVQFTDNSVEAPYAWLWDFGDGATSVEQNPLYNYLSSGPKTVTLTATNCVSIDVDTLQLSVQPPPGISIVPSSLNVVFPNCEDSMATTLWIVNTGNGELQFEQGAAAITDDFEGTVVNPDIWFSTSGQLTDDCGTNTGASALYFDASGARNATTLPLTLTSGAEIRFFLKYGTGSSPCEAVDSGENVVLECSVDGDPFQTIIALTDISAFTDFTEVSAAVPAAAIGVPTTYRIRQIDFSGSVSDHWAMDDFSISGSNASVSMTPPSANVAAGDSVEVQVMIQREDLTAGSYQTEFQIGTNVPGAPVIVVPITLQIQGLGILRMDSSCVQFTEIPENTSIQDSILVGNTGCAPLVLSNFTTSSPFVVGTGTITIEPNDSVYVLLDFSPDVFGSYVGELTFEANGGPVTRCLQGSSYGAPDITVSPDTLVLSGTNCPDSISGTITLSNPGNGPLEWVVGGTTADDFEGTQMNTAIWESSTGVNSTNCGAHLGTKSHWFNSSGVRYIRTLPFSISTGTHFSFYLQYAAGSSPCELLDAGEHVALEYSLNGSTWTIINEYDVVADYFMWTLIDEQMPPGASGPQTRLRLVQYSNSGSAYDNWNIDDAMLTVSGMGGVVASPPSGTVPVGGTTVVDITLDADLIDAGSYLDSVIILTNIPGNPSVAVPLVISIQGSAQLTADLQGCLDLGAIFTTTSSTDSIYISNTGCAPLQISSIGTDNPEFSVASAPAILASEEGAWVQVEFNPISVGELTATLNIESTGGDLSLCIEGEGLAAPVLQVAPAFLQVDFTACTDTVIAQITLQNTGGSDLDFDFLYNDEETSLDSVLARWTSGNQQVLDQLPAPFLFTNGVTSYYISDGGSNMYDNGNYLNTDLYSYINYANNTIGGSGEFGASGQYFTSKVSGMFMLAADLDGVDEFNVLGTPGQYGNGAVDVATLTHQAAGRQFTGYLKRVHGHTTPSINQLIIVETDPGIQRTYGMDTYTDDHFVSGLTGTGRLYYLLFSTASGAYVTGPQAQAILASFLGVIYSNVATDIDPATGTILPGGSQTVDITFVNDNAVAGTYNSTLYITTNAPGSPMVEIPVIINVPDMPCASFMFDYANGCQGEFLFTNTTVNDAGTWHWDFGDGTTSVNQNPQHLYASTGFYTVTLTVGTEPLTSQYSMEVFAQPVAASFIHTAPTAGGLVQFASTSPTAEQWLWNFGDGGTSIEEAPTHVYQNEGTYLVTLTVWDANGCLGSITATVVYGDVGVAETIMDGLNVFPNPTTGRFTIHSEVAGTGILASVLDGTGRVVITERPIGKGDTTMDIGHLANGIYLLRLRIGGHEQQVRLTKQ